MPPGLTRCEAEHLFAVGTQSQACLYNTYICAHMYNTCMYTASQKINTYWHSQCSNKPNQHQQPYPVPLTGWPGSGWRSICGKCTYREIHNVDPSSNWPETLSLASGCPWIPGRPSCWHLGTWPSSAVALFPLPVQNTLAHTWKCTHTQTHMLRTSLHATNNLDPYPFIFPPLFLPKKPWLFYFLPMVLP